MGSWREEWETGGYRAALNNERTDHVRVRFQHERRRFSASPSSTRPGALWAIDRDVYPVVRYDTAHGYVHRDTMDWTGRVVDKLPIYGRAYNQAINQAMTEAIADIRSHWRTY